MRPTLNMTRSVIAAGAMALASVGIAACTSSSPGASADCESPYTIAFSHPSSDAVVVKAIKRYIEKAADADGCVSVLFDSTQGNNLESQRATIESWITQGVDAITVFPVDSASLTSLMKQAQAQDTKWLTYSSPMEGQDGMVGFDNDKMGQLIADDLVSWISENYPERNLSAAVTTLTPLPSLEGRWERPIQVLEEIDVPVVSAQDCPVHECGLNIAADTLLEHPDLRVFIGMTDDPALGALRAFERADVDLDEVYLGGMDGSPEALEAVKEGGAYRATVALRVDILGEMILQNSLNAIRGDGETTSEAPVELATLADPEGLDELLRLYSE
jgi:ABC-type sugar transport system substrate-binding protein